MFAGCRPPETTLMGKDLDPSMYDVLFLPLAMVVLLSTLGQKIWDVLSDR
jgi:hypothetical protein